MSKPPDLVQGTLDLLLLKILALEPLHGWAISQRLKQVSGDELQVSDGSLYPALHKLELAGWITAEWKTSELGRRAKFYSLTRAGRRYLDQETAHWHRLTSAISRVLALQGDLTMEWRRWIYAIPARLTPSSARGASRRTSTMSWRFMWRCRPAPTHSDGMSDAEAYRRARVEIGGVEQVKERSRDVRPLRWARDAMQDVRYGLRGLRKTPRFTIAAVLTVVLGVGANATIFSVLNPLLFKPLPYPEPDRIVNVFRTSPQSDRWPHSMGNYLDHRARNRSFEHLAAMMVRDTSLADPDQPAERLFASAPAATSSPLFGGAPLIGRAFDDADDQTGAEPVVVLSHRILAATIQRRSRHCRPSMRLDGRRRRSIGVMPENFEYPLFWGTIEIWRPLAFAGRAAD